MLYEYELLDNTEALLFDIGVKKRVDFLSTHCSSDQEESLHTYRWKFNKHYFFNQHSKR